MIRYILCEQCGQKFKLHPEDAARGFLMRKRVGRAHCSADHGVTVTEAGKASEFTPLNELRCDHCNASIETWAQGTYAVTMWPKELGTPGDWEKEYFVAYKDAE